MLGEPGDGGKGTDQSCEVGINLEKKSHNTNSGRIDDYVVMRTEAKGAEKLAVHIVRNRAVGMGNQ